ncbi:XRE family transcriptional regulator [Streptomyces sp. NPDC047061]|uniref:XRE family transcriptional regulator n=1 Tax=Streptomyces sp. NPDC047061 TaxID=3154605 RepID=UPI0033DF29EA
MTGTVPLNDLGEFLKKCRAELSPRTVGLPESGGPRRAAGLRREEVAQLASISTDYYTRLEQGRMQASAPVLGVLARVLHLNDDERSYLFQLAGRTAGRTRRRGRQKVQARLQRVLDDLTATPAIVQSDASDVQHEIEFQLYGAIAATKAVLPAMREAGAGTLLYTTGAGSLDPVPVVGNVNAAAAALRNWAVNLHEELDGTGVQAAHIALDVSIAVALIPGSPVIQPEDISPVYWDLHTTERDRAELVFKG